MQGLKGHAFGVVTTLCARDHCRDGIFCHNLEESDGLRSAQNVIQTVRMTNSDTLEVTGMF